MRSRNHNYNETKPNWSERDPDASRDAGKQQRRREEDTSRQNTFARTWCAIQARWHNTEYPRRATLESINPIMCVKHRSRQPSLGRRILFIITLKTIVNSVVRLAMTLLSQKTDHPEDSSKWLRSRTSHIHKHKKKQHKQSSREQDRTQVVFHEQHYYKTFCFQVTKDRAEAEAEEGGHY